ncbi:hypothetical protein D3C78_745160 [compost metagenome]
MGHDGVQVTVEAGDLGVIALLQIQHGAVEDLRQGLGALDHQQGLLEAQGLDHALLDAVRQTQLTLATAAGGC